MTDDNKHYSVRCILKSYDGEKLVFVGIEDDLTYVAPKRCLRENDVLINSEYLICYWERCSENGPDGTILLQKAEVCSRENLLHEYEV